jgi:putative phosphoribosyl transferase
MDDGFVDRLDAGRRLGLALEEYRSSDALVLGLARGGVVVGYAVAEALALPLQALVVRKLGAPQNPELAIGAVSETGKQWLDPAIVRATGATGAYIEREVAEQIAEARRRQHEYAVGPGLESIRGKPAIVVDDGVATGSTALVAIESARGLGAAEIVVGTPVASRQAMHLLGDHVDRLVVLAAPDPFVAVGLYYHRFDQTTDDEVVHYLRSAQEREEVQQ